MPDLDNHFAHEVLLHHDVAADELLHLPAQLTLRHKPLNLTQLLCKSMDGHQR
jgi:hypothetical protein